MSEENIITGPNGKRVKLGDKHNEQKPMFTISPSVVFTNLHYAAQRKAISKINDGKQKIDDLNKILINTGMSDNGKYMDTSVNYKITDGTIDQFVKKVSDMFRPNTQYDIGIIFQVTKFPDLKNLPDDEKARREQIHRLTQRALEPLKRNALTALNEYFKWFAGQDDAFSMQDIEEFEPDYEGGRIQTNNFRIPGIDSTTISRKLSDSIGNNMEYNTHRDDDVRDVHREHGTDNGSDYIPRIGYKVSYKLVN